MKRGIWIHPRDFDFESPGQLAERLKDFDKVICGPVDTFDETYLYNFKANSDNKLLYCTPMDKFRTVSDYFDGVMLDFVRFDNFSWWNIFRTNQITKQVKHISNFLKLNGLTTDLSLKALECPAKWGVNYKALSKYVDAVCPMIYTELYGLPQNGFHVYDIAKQWQRTGKCEPILQTYYDPTEAPMKKPTRDKLDYEVDLVKKAGCQGYSQFRYRADWGWQL